MDEATTLPATHEVEGIPRRALWRRIIRSRFVWIALAICVLGYFLYGWLDEIGGPKVFRERYGAIAPLISIPVMAVATISPFPSDLIAIANGSLYGFALGTLWSALAWWIAAQFQYLLGWQMRADLDLGEQTRSLPQWLRNFPVSHPLFLILSRQIPWAGGHVSTLIPAAAGVSYFRHAWCSAIAVFPGALLYAAIGVGLLAIS